jgi:hypothetical protein
MSDNWLVLIPDNPRFMPETANQSRALDRFAELARDASEIELVVSDTIEFFDCGTNFECIRCPSCKSGIALAWWQDRMNEDYGNGFKLAGYQTPCCGAHCTLDTLVYERAQGFARFGLRAMNPNLGKLEESHKKEFEQILGTKLRVIYQHL